uniref:Acyl transferase domain-containing protein n=1 Tax=Candidatus Kentrum sp. DK TaxID=2126562 RepID=A0A450RUU4_9GAMM|nr:MAG: Acyl transferase domain-containing protein [Candidatus Kentron sp. DK]
MSHHKNERQGLSPLQQAAFALERMQAKLDAMESARTEPVAIIGMGCRFPGADNPDAYWQLLRDGVDAVTEVPPERWDIDAFFDPEPGVPGKVYTREAGFVSGIDRFDPRFFGISPREAADMDPQHRLLLEVVWEALENAGQSPEKLMDSPVGVFIGVTQTEYSTLQLSGRPEDIGPYALTGGGVCFTAGRVSYTLGLQGPTVGMDTACSSSLVAIHMACQSLRGGESELALAGGVNLNLTPEMTVGLSRTQSLSPDGRCKTFDASADGFARGEGCGVVVLKRLSDAIADRDNILALIRGSAINHDGISSGFTVPNELAQQKLLRQALKSAGVTAADVSYIEAHGTGTSLGDPIELEALGAVFARDHSPDLPLTIGSVKTNLGHLEAAAGIAGLIKIVLSLQHETIPAHLHFKTPNPHVDWDRLPFRVPVKAQPWPRGQGDNPRPRVAGVSSFGMSGTNAHVVLEEAPVVDDPANPSEEVSGEPDRSLHLLALSARDETALGELAERFANHLEDHPALSFADVCFTAGAGRSHFPHRLAVIAISPEEARTQLRAGGAIAGRIEAGRPKTAFLFTGQGSQYPEMGRGLYRTEPLFREALDRCDEILRPLAVPLLDLLYGKNANPESLNQTIHTQPALFSLEYALAKLWQSWGIQPDAVMGHSVGEYVAACIAGVFSLEDALTLIAARGRLMQTLCEPGNMLALQTTETEALALIAPFDGALSLAAINGPESQVVSGEPAAMEALKAALAERGVKAKALSVSHAFHSAMMAPMLAEFEKVADSIAYAEPGIALCSNVTGKMVAAGEVTGPAYWVRHVREPVRFAQGVETLIGRKMNCFLEVGPRPSLLGMARECLPDGADDTRTGWLPSLREGQDDRLLLLQSLGQWYTRGGKPDWQTLAGGTIRRKVPLPTYPFQRQRYWIDEIRLARRAGGSRDASAHPLLGQRLRLPGAVEPRFQADVDLLSAPYLSDHRIFDVVVVPGAAWLEAALTAASRLLPGAKDSGAPLGIGSLAFEQVLILPEKEITTIQSVLSPTEGGYDVQFFSLGDESDSRLHVTGRLIAEPLEKLPAPRDLAALRERCPTEIPAADIYRILQHHGVNLGPAFQGVQQVFQGERFLLGRLRLPEAAHGPDTGGYRLHPVLIDSGFQMTILAEFFSSNSDEEGVYVPAAVGEMRFYGPGEGELWVFVEFGDPVERNLVADVTWFDGTGAVVAEVEGLMSTRVDPQTLRRHFRKQTDDLYELTWREIPRKATRRDAEEPPAEQRTASWLILADSGGLGEELASRLEGRGERCVLAYAGTGGAVGAIHEPPLPDGNTYHIDPANPEDFQRLFHDACPPGAPPLAGIVYLWALDAPEDPELTVEALREAQHLVLGGALHLTQAAIGRDKSAKIWLVTRNGVATGHESGPRAAAAGPLSIAQASLWGMGRTIALEYPELWGGLLDDPSVEDLLGEMEAGEAPEQQPSPGEDWIAWRAGRRYVARLTPGGAPPASSPPPRADASYLITGGLGGLGLTVARSLVAGGARNLILIGRRAPSEAAKEVLRELEHIGARILVASADVADAGRMAALFREMAEQMPPLKGVIHTAGVLDDGVLQEQNLARLDRVLAPKVAGGWILHTLTRDLPLDFFVCFSSMTSILGSSGQVNYAAANAFLDALAHYRHALGLPGLSLDWGTWGEVGMAANLDTRARERLAGMGIDVIDPERGVSIMTGLMGDPDRIQVGVFPVDWAGFLKRFPKPPGLLSELVRGLPAPVEISFLEGLKALAPEARWDYVSGRIRSELNGVLGFDPAQPMESDMVFTDIGMDSLMIVESRNRLRTSLGLGTALPTTLLFDYPTLDKLTDYIADEVLNLEGGRSVPDDASSAPERDGTEVSEDAMARVRELSEQELQDRFDKELEAFL